MKLVKMYRSRVVKQGFVDEARHNIIEKYIAWGYFLDAENGKHKAAIRDGSGSIKHDTREAALESISICRETFRKLNIKP